MFFNKRLLHIAILLTYLVSCDSNQKKNIEKLVSTSFVKEHIGGEGYVIIDARTFQAYEKGHIPGAIHWNADDWMGENCMITYDVPDKSSIEEQLEELNVSADQHLLIYDDQGGCKATKIWWLLKNHGYENVSIINGGITKWKEDQWMMEMPYADSERTEIEIRKQQQLSVLAADLMYVKNQVSKDNLRFLTCNEVSDSVGNQLLVTMNMKELFRDETTKELKTPIELNELYTQKGLERENEIIVFCAEKEEGALIQFILQELLKYPKVRQFSGDFSSLSETSLNIN